MDHEVPSSVHGARDVEAALLADTVRGPEAPGERHGREDLEPPLVDELELVGPGPDGEGIEDGVVLGVVDAVPAQLHRLRRGASRLAHAGDPCGRPVSRSSRLSTLPLALRGRAPTTTTCAGTL